MKKLFIAALFISALSLTACHYGRQDAEKTLERNELYKGDKHEYSVNRATDGTEAAPAEAAADTTAKPAAADTTAKAEATHEAK